VERNFDRLQTWCGCHATRCKLLGMLCNRGRARDVTARRRHQRVVLNAAGRRDGVGGTVALSDGALGLGGLRVIGMAKDTLAVHPFGQDAAELDRVQLHLRAACPGGE
jgi:hypothetical protein